MNSFTFIQNKIHIFENIEDISEFAFQKWEELSKKTIDERKKFGVALSGGNTPIRLYEKLSHTCKKLPWKNTYIFMADERLVPWDTSDSNYGLVRKKLLNNIDIPEKNVHPVSIESSAGKSAKKYEEDIEKFFNSKENGFPVFDLIVLGLGKDGHTASLFPGDKAIHEKKRSVIAANPENIRHERISLTLPTINNARNIIFMVSGIDKAETVKKVLEEERSNLPASLVHPKRGEVFFLFDRDAGSLLKK